MFASPETVAAATAYIAARLSLLADAHEYTARRDQGYESQIAGLRRTVAADRYGLASQVLATRDGCTADACDAFGLVYDDKKLRANMKDRLFDVTVARYAVNWPTRTRPLASSGRAAPSGRDAAGTERDFPSVAVDPAGQHHERRAAAAPPPRDRQPQARLRARSAPPTNSAPASATKRRPPRAAQEGRDRRRCRSIPRQAISPPEDNPRGAVPFGRALG